MDIIDYIIRIGFVIAWMIISFMFGAFVGGWVKRNEHEEIKRCIDNNMKDLIKGRVK